LSRLLSFPGFSCSTTNFFSRSPFGVSRPRLLQGRCCLFFFFQASLLLLHVSWCPLPPPLFEVGLHPRDLTGAIGECVVSLLNSSLPSVPWSGREYPFILERSLHASTSFACQPCSLLFFDFPFLAFGPGGKMLFFTPNLFTSTHSCRASPSAFFMATPCVTFGHLLRGKNNTSILVLFAHPSLVSFAPSGSAAYPLAVFLFFFPLAAFSLFLSSLRYFSVPPRKLSLLRRLFPPSAIQRAGSLFFFFLNPSPLFLVAPLGELSLCQSRVFNGRFLARLFFFRGFPSFLFL